MAIEQLLIESGGWVAGAVVGVVWLLREFRARRKQATDVNREFAERMLRREETLVNEVKQLRLEVAELRLMLVNHGIDPKVGM